MSLIIASELHELGIKADNLGNSLEFPMRRLLKQNERYRGKVVARLCYQARKAREENSFSKLLTSLCTLRSVGNTVQGHMDQV